MMKSWQKAECISYIYVQMAKIRKEDKILPKIDKKFYFIYVIRLVK